MPNITVEQFRTETLDPNTDYTLKDTGANLATLTTDELASLASLSVNHIDASDNTLTLTVAQYAALEPFLHGGTHQTDLTGGDFVTLADTGANLSALTSSQWSWLDNNHIDAVVATEGGIALSYEAYKATNWNLIKNADPLTLLDTRGNIEVLKEGQIDDLNKKGFDFIDSTSDFLILTEKQYNKLGDIQLTAADVVRIDVNKDYVLSDDLDNLMLLGTGNWNGTGNAFDNTITGNEGNNTLDGAGGSDDLSGGLGDDTYIIDGGDTIHEDADAGTDTVISSATYKLAPFVENLTLTGDANINGMGNRMDNTIIGNDGDNRIFGGKGQDMLSGGLGADKFCFTQGDSSANPDNADHIEDFSTAQGDKIIVGYIDADINIDGNQAFNFIGDAAFSNTAGELAYTVSGDEYTLMGDTDGDGAANFTIIVHSATALTATDFVL